jgi:molecular chaperone GrpE
MNDHTESQHQEPQGDNDVFENEEGNGALDEQSSLRDALQKLAQAETLIMHQKDEVLRVQAEMQNLRRRTELDVEKAHKFGQEKLSAELLAVMDNLERALQVAVDRENESVKSLLQGVELTLKSFSDCFRKFGIAQLDPLGEPFDPQVHQAMVMQENPNVDPDTVTAVMLANNARLVVTNQDGEQERGGEPNDTGAFDMFATTCAQINGLR